MKAGKIQYFDPGDEEFAPGESAVAETERGLEAASVAIAPSQVLMQKTKGPLPKIVRKATPEDLAGRDRNKARAEELYNEARAAVRDLNLDMKIIEAFLDLTGARLTVSYTSEERIEFRPILQRLGAKHPGKIDLKQMGPRDHTKALGGMGRCGRELCCSSWLTEFAPVTMKMAKEQDLPLSPPGLAGVCGRLRCCLRYEYEQYRDLKQGLPKIGATVTTSNGPARVVVGHPLKQTVTVQLESGAWVEVSMAELDGTAPAKPLPAPVAAPSASDGMGRVEPRPPQPERDRRDDRRSGPRGDRRDTRRNEPRNEPRQGGPRDDRRDQPRGDRRDDRRGPPRQERRDQRPQEQRRDDRGPQQGPPPSPPAPPPQDAPQGQ
jgi:cell fate regulator YaaT (PSP1 superfamily)